MRRIAFAVSILLIAAIAIFIFGRPAEPFDVFSTPIIQGSNLWEFKGGEGSVETYFTDNRHLLVDHLGGQGGDRMIEIVDLQTGKSEVRPDLAHSLILNQGTKVRKGANSPDGKYLLYRALNKRVLLLPVDGSPPRLIPAVGNVLPRTFLWRPDSISWWEVYDQPSPLFKVYLRSLPHPEIAQIQGDAGTILSLDGVRAVSDNVVETVIDAGPSGESKTGAIIVMTDLSIKPARATDRFILVSLSGNMVHAVAAPNGARFAWLMQEEGPPKRTWIDSVLRRTLKATHAIVIALTDNKGQELRQLSYTPASSKRKVNEIKWFPDGKSVLIRCSDGFRILKVP